MQEISRPSETQLTVSWRGLQPVNRALLSPNVRHAGGCAAASSPASAATSPRTSAPPDMYDRSRRGKCDGGFTTENMQAK